MRVNPGGRIVHMGKRIYSYEDMRVDIWKLWKRYKEFLEVRILEKTLDQRNIYCIRMGGSGTSRSILVNASLHGREWLNTHLMMLLLEHYCRSYDTGMFWGERYRALFEKVCVYLLPMMNPDGVSVSQFGTGAVRNPELRQNVRMLAGTQRRFWKANARGVDLNRNFDIGFWENPVKNPASMGYGGREPFCEPETRALVRLVDTVQPDGVINYHEAGPLIYYTEVSDLLWTVTKITGYPLVREEGGCPGSFGDWLAGRGIDYCTVETCVGKAPAGHWQIYPAYVKNYHVMAAAAAVMCRAE